MYSLLKRLYQRGMPLYFFLTTLTTTTLVAFFGLIVYAMHIEHLELERDSIQTQFQTVSEKIQQGFDDRISPIMRLVEANATLPISSEILNASPTLRAEFMQKYLYVIACYPKIFSINYGFKNGNFVYFVNIASITKPSNLTPPPHAKFLSVYNFLDSQKNNQVIMEYYDQNLKLLSTTSAKSNYTPTSSPWYIEAIEANKLIVTSPYKFSTVEQFGITVAIPRADNNGVYAVSSTIDIMMESVSSSLHSEQASIYLMDTQTKNIITKHIDPKHKNIFNTSDCEVIAYDGTILRNKTDIAKGTCNVDSIASQIAKSYDPLNTDVSKNQFSAHGETFHFELANTKFKNQNLDFLIIVNTANRLKNLHDAFYNVLIFMAFLILITIPITHIIALKVSKPISKLMGEAIRIRNNDFSPSPHINTSVKEIKSLVSSVGSMKQSLAEYINQLFSDQEILQNKVEEKTKELNNALTLANAATHAKGQFLSTMSHELRTPMNAILGFTYIFDRSNLSDDQKQQLEKIRISSESLLYIINDVLDFSKLEAGKLNIESIPFSLDELLHSTTDMIQQLATAKGLELIMEKDKDLPNFLIGDPNRLRQVLINLIGNAIKFTEKGHVKICIKRTVRLQLSEKNKPDLQNTRVSIAFSVQDTGIGMTEEQMSTLFQSFSQADASISRKFGGSGLGLNISKQLISLMGGEISAQSQKGLGSEFSAYLTFETTQANAVSAKEIPSEQKRYKENALALVVDDNQINLEVAKALLGKAKINADTAKSGKEAIEKIKAQAYDIIFMDIQMPEMDGFTACSLIRAMANDSDAQCATNVKDVPIIAMTANAMSEDRLKCIEAGMNEHIAKPVTPSRLFDVVQEWLAIADEKDDKSSS